MIAIVDYGAGNVASVANALVSLGQEFRITSSASEINGAEKIIFPGVGQASFAMNQLASRNLINVLQRTKKPLLGICLGMQLLCEFSEEGNTDCLAIFPGKIKQFDPNKTKVPHIGWNTVRKVSPSPLFDGIRNDEFFYFANSFYLPKSKWTTAATENSVNFTAVIEKDNFHGVQFHPEKSSSAGLQLLKNFINLF